MTLEQKLVLKMEPHAKRIVDGGDNDFDYLPAVLLQLMEQQKRLALQFDNNAELIKEISSKVSAAELSNKAQIATGVRASKESSHYLCGLECDGARYHSSWRARTNDVWRQEILESKGWKILRIWSTDWFENSEEAKNKLAKELLALRDAVQSKAVFTQHQFIRRASIDQVAD